MLSSSRAKRASTILVALAALVPLSACGFHPLYGKSSATAYAVPAEMAAIRVGAIDDRRGQLLRNDLIERLTPRGEPTRPHYTLNVTLIETMTGLGQQVNSFATLGEMQITGIFQLVGADGKPRMGGTSMSTVSVNYLGPRYGSVAVQRDAEERALEDIADDIRDQVGIYLRNPQVARPTAPAKVETVAPVVQTPQSLQAVPMDLPAAP